MENVRQRRNISEQNDKTSEKKTPSNKKSDSNRRWLRVVSFIPFIVLLAIQLAYLLSPISAVYIEGIEPIQFDGPFAVNTKLSVGKRFPMFAPESIVEDEFKNLYVGLRDGKIVKIFPSKHGAIGEGETEVLAEGELRADGVTGQLPDGLPLGLRLRGSVLFVMDANYGMYTLDVITRKRKVLVTLDAVTPPMKFPNDLDITVDGKTIYFTDSSYKHSIHELISEVLEGPCTGRLFAYDVATKEIRTVIDGLCFANGVQLTRDEKTVIVPETARYRVSWIDVATAKKKHIIHLPAMPDNVRRNRRGLHWVGASTRMDSKQLFLLQYPFLRQAFVGLLPESILIRIPNRRHNMVFEVNDVGEIFSSRHDPTGNLTYALSQATELSDGRLALGTYAAPFLAIADRPDEH